MIYTCGPRQLLMQPDHCNLEQIHPNCGNFMNFAVSSLPRKNALWLLVPILALAALVYWLLPSGDENAATLVEQIQRGDIENFISATGKLEPKHFVEVGAQVSGQLKRILVEEGDEVQAGDLVAEIDATVFETRVQNAAASLEGNRAQLQQLQAELELASLRARRNRNLHEQNAVSDDVLFESETNEKILRARIRAMEAQIKADSASLAGDQATLGYAKIYAPIDGTVVSIAVREGQTLNANQNAPVLLKIANLDVLTLRAEVSEADVTRLHAGMPIYFKTFGGGERRWHSQVRQVLPTPSVINDVVLYQALIDVDNEDGSLMDAMTTQVFFVLDQARNALLVPLGAVVGRGAHTSVKVQTAGGTKETPVKLGVRNRTHAQVLEGLSAGDTVIIGAKARTGDEAATGLRGRRGF